MTFSLKISSPSHFAVGPESSVSAIMQALVEARTQGVGPSGIEDAANLAVGSLEPEYESLGLIDPTADDAGVKLASDFLVEKAGSGALLRFDDKVFQDFLGGRWRRLEKAKLRRQLYAHMRSRPEMFGPPSQTLCRDAIGELEILCYREPVWDDPGRAGQILNLRSLELHVAPDGTIALRPHSPWSEQASVCAYDHDPVATSPRFDKALAEIVSANDDPAGMERHLMEVLAYGILSWRDIACVVFLKGAGANGKSLLLKVIASMLDADQTMWGSVKRLTGDKFSLPDLAGKRLFIEDDAPDDVAIDQGVLKSIAEDKPLMVRRAYATHSTAIRASILPIISSNGAPRFVETSHGFARRLLIIPFRRRFEPYEMDRNLAAKIIADERPGILNRLIEAHARLRERGYFDPPQECLRATEEMLSTGNSLQAYIDQMTVAKPGARTTVTAIYEDYRRWERTNGGRPVCERNKLPSKLEAMGFKVGKCVGVKCLHDVAITSGTAEVADAHAH
tara:strand:+ start:483 stop:2003 length:1521 start_codon:yes stop_codon:yes gene_type:complete